MGMAPPRRGALSIPFWLTGAAICWAWYCWHLGLGTAAPGGGRGFLQLLRGGAAAGAAAGRGAAAAAAGGPTATSSSSPGSFGRTRPHCPSVHAAAAARRRRLLLLGGAAAPPRRTALRVGLHKYSTSVLAGALRTLGYENVPRQAAKSRLIQLIIDVDVPEQLLQEALQQAQRGGGRGGGGRGGGGRKGGGSAKSRRSNLWSSDTADLRAALNELGVQGTASWPKKRLVEAFMDIGRQVEGAASSCSEHGKHQQNGRKAKSATKKEGRPSGRSGRKPAKEEVRQSKLWGCESGQLRAKLNSLGVAGTSQWSKQELVETLVGMGMVAEEVGSIGQGSGSGGSGQRTQQKGKQKKKGQQRNGAGTRRQKERLHYAGQSLGPDDPLEDELRWLEREGRRNRRRAPASKRWHVEEEDEDDFYKYHLGYFDDDSDDEDDEWLSDLVGEDPGYEGEYVYYHDVDINDYINGFRAYSASSSATGAPFPHVAGRPAAAAPQAAPISSEKAMERALCEKWSPERLSLHQAAQLLGVSGQPTALELRAARKKLVHQWHPDRNPDRKDGTEALQLVLAAVAKFG